MLQHEICYISRHQKLRHNFRSELKKLNLLFEYLDGQLKNREPLDFNDEEEFKDTLLNLTQIWQDLAVSNRFSDSL